MMFLNVKLVKIIINIVIFKGIVKHIYVKTQIIQEDVIIV